MGHEIKAGEKEEEWLLFLCSLDTWPRGMERFIVTVSISSRRLFKKISVRLHFSSGLL